ncbi:helix-turn-helix domain-containing protein [Pelosinus propionicus]|uniref:DNA binding domain-containing protein, excisionase family n=1 Tax=Pelosinus propionicus DSM 13327 TaxID=1123291 RepID=A0A1I4N862_9FIRM|nr:helix-turn-helix domain-containing protein [Pelosinus propionicus]SFM11679.1 DNA binding domain-containing protein, excisionase family [Pelosinus propionicus DSM 13327]
MDEYLTPDEVGKILKVNEKVIGDLLNSGDIPGIKIGHLWRIPKAKFEKCFESNIKPIKAINNNLFVQSEKFDIEKTYDCDEVAERYRVKKLTVWQWIRDKKLNAVQTGKNYRIRQEDLKEFEDARSTKW